MKALEMPWRQLTAWQQLGSNTFAVCLGNNPVFLIYCSMNEGKIFAVPPFKKILNMKKEDDIV